MILHCMGIVIILALSCCRDLAVFRAQPLFLVLLELACKFHRWMCPCTRCLNIPLHSIEPLLRCLLEEVEHSEEVVVDNTV